jgi:hypothetical protein
MKISELLDENLLLKGLSAIKNMGTKAATTSSDDAIRAAQDARANAFGRTGGGIAGIKPGQNVRLQTADAAKDSRFASLIQRDKGMHLHNYVDGKVLEIVPATRAGFPDMMKVKLQTGEVVNWPVDRFMNTLR